MKLLRFGWRPLRSVALAFSRLLHPRNALPSVGLIVLGGCLTFIISPDEPEAQPPAQTWEEKGEFPLVVIDAGHGGRDEGTMWRGLSERDLTLDLARRVERQLKIAGFRTLLTRDSDTYVSLEERTRIANRQQNAVFISIHFNSESTTSSSGIETYYARTKEIPVNDWAWVGFFNKGETAATDTSEELAGSIQTALVMQTEAKNRGIHPKNFYVVHHTRCPSVLVEAGFISNAFESQLLLTEPYRETLALAITEGLLRYQKNRLEEAAPSVPTTPPPPEMVTQ